MEDGVEYVVVNWDLGEYIDPFYRDEFIRGDADNCMDEAKFALILLCAMKHFWAFGNVSLVTEDSDDYQEILFGEGYVEITSEVMSYDG